MLLGNGVPLFKGGFERTSLKLTKATPLQSGVVILHYEPQREMTRRGRAALICLGRCRFHEASLVV